MEKEGVYVIVSDVEVCGVKMSGLYLNQYYSW